MADNNRMHNNNHHRHRCRSESAHTCTQSTLKIDIEYGRSESFFRQCQMTHQAIHRGAWNRTSSQKYLREDLLHRCVWCIVGRASSLSRAFSIYFDGCCFTSEKMQNQMKKQISNNNNNDNNMLEWNAVYLLFPRSTTCDAIRGPIVLIHSIYRMCVRLSVQIARASMCANVSLPSSQILAVGGTSPTDTECNFA